MIEFTNNIHDHILAAVTDIDTSGIHALEDLFKNLKKREIQVVHNH